ncbi:FAD-dependent monooxygenase [Streptomyces sp. NEAU-Y11]|uniref:FAD-dependent monooxygenase n=1 Tax=Streptomyces cucumeris TaxID=2962890 RepID=UPI0020C91DD9|nr:FAD-dependent monooxygenase [Streptomyces sp. NEAU-Y11]MCP9212041.1 FAD-dependent monooxygenase [Streptomyces sp. NEAU-Y11]
MTDVDVPVLIVGGGGAGLTASMLLSTLGVESLLVSASPGTSILPKAHLLNQRTMETLRELGLDETIYASGCPPRHMTHSGWYAGFAGDHPDAGRRIAELESWGAAGSTPEWAAASPQRPTNLPQIRLEPHLRRRAEELAGPDRVRFHHELREFTQDADGVSATVLDKDTGQEYRVRARYLLGCDGGRTVGRILGIRAEGMRDVARMVSLHITADLSAWAKDPHVLIRWLWLPEAGVMGTLVPMGPERWGPESEEWVFHLNYGADDARALDDESVVADMRTALGIGDHPVRIHIISRWSLEGIVAERFRDGRVFLLGDAAHRHPPTGGLGLNSAVQDAHNLAWKLAAVITGQAGEALLDTYETERRPVTSTNVQRALDNALNHLATNNLISGSGSGWAHMGRLWSGEPRDAEFARAVRRAIAGQSMEFNEQNIECGFIYDSAAVVPDGSPAPDNPDPIRIHHPTARPGHPLPHAWLEDWHGTRLPVMDLVGPGRWLLVAGEDGQAWIGAAAQAAAALGVPLDAVRIGHLDGDYRDPRSTWTRLRGHGADGAVLIRPDRVVAWRSPGTADDPYAALKPALHHLLAR